MINNSFIRRVGACAVLLAALGLASCKSDSSSNSGDTIAQTVTVIAEDTPQSDLLGEIYAQALENAGFRVARRNDVPDLAAGYAALQSGAVVVVRPDQYVAHVLPLTATAELGAFFRQLLLTR